MAETTSTTFRIGRGATSVHDGLSLGHGVTVGRMNGGVGISTSAGSMSISKSSYHHSSSHSSGIGSGAAYSSLAAIGNGASASAISRSSRETSSVVSTPTIVNGDSHSHSVRTTVIESGIGSVADTTSVVITGAQMFAEATRREKEEMQRLNDRLSNYIARVKQLEEQNKQLVTSLSELRGRWGAKNDSFKVSYSVTVDQLRADKDNASRLRIAKDVAVSRLNTEIIDYRTRIEDVARITEVERRRVPQWLAAISDADNELANLGKRYEALRVEERLALNESERYRKDLAELNLTLDGVLVEKLGYQAQLLSIRDEIKFLKTVQSEEVRELQALLVVAPADTKEFFRNELALAVRDIRKEYQLLASAGKIKLESWYKSKVHSIQELTTRRADHSVFYLERVKGMTTSMTELSATYSQMEERNRSLEMEVSKLQKQVHEDHLSYEQAMMQYDSMLIRMREECATLVAELQSLLDSKAILDGEIAIYRAMIEGEERRVGVVVKHVVEETRDQWEVATKTKFNTIAHGHIAIVQSDPTGRFIAIANNSNNYENIGRWRIERTIDKGAKHGRVLNYYFPHDFKIPPKTECDQERIYIFAKGQGTAEGNNLVFEDETSWGMGANITTALYDAAGVEKAVYTQVTVFSKA